MRLASVAGVVVAVGAMGLLWVWSRPAAIAALIVAIASPLSRRLRIPEPAVEPAGVGWVFGGERIAFRPVSEVLDHTPREIAERLAARYEPGRVVEMVLWIVATDRTGQPWTLVQDRYGDHVPSVTASAVGIVPGACDPYLEAQRLALAETGLALADVLVVGWGSDTSLDARRDTIIVIGQTSVGAEELGSHEYQFGDRRSHLVELHPDSVARSLGSVDARRWQAAAIRGLVRGMEVLYPGSGTLLEELVAEPWRNRRMFGRLGRLTDGAVDREEPQIVHPVVLKVVDGGLTEEREERMPIRMNRALSWERSARTIPTRYG